MTFAALIARAPCSLSDPLRVGVLASGNGSNLQALIDATHSNHCPFIISHVIANEPHAFALERAWQANVSQQVINHRDFSQRDEFESVLVNAFLSKEVEIVVLAGFMRILSKVFLHSFRNRTLGIHPALCPSFPGLNAVKQALTYGAKITGCTVYLVDGGVDSGPVIAQSAVPIYNDDSEELLHERVKEKERELFSQVLADVARGLVGIDRGKICLRQSAQ